MLSGAADGAHGPRVAGGIDVRVGLHVCEGRHLSPGCGIAGQHEDVPPELHAGVHAIGHTFADTFEVTGDAKRGVQ